MSRVDWGWLEECKARLVSRAEERDLLVGADLDGAIDREAEKGGFREGVHRLVLVREGEFAGYRIKERRITPTIKVKERRLVTFRMRIPLLEKLDEMSRKLGRTKIEIVEKAMRRYLKFLAGRHG